MRLILAGYNLWFEFEGNLYWIWGGGDNLQIAARAFSLRGGGRPQQRDKEDGPWRSASYLAKPRVFRLLKHRIYENEQA